MNEAVNKCSSLIREKNDLEKELLKKTNELENLKNSNYVPQRNSGKSNASNSKLEEESKM